MGDKDRSERIEVEPEVILEIDDDDDNSGCSSEIIRNSRRLLSHSMNSYFKIIDPFTLASKMIEEAKYSNHKDLEQCPQCGKYYRKLARHMLKHEQQVKSLNCEHCSKAFDKRIELELHLRTHTGHKPFVCGLCHKAFSQNCNLINHVRTHTGDKPFKCAQCSKAFTQSGNLKNHMRLHNDEKPFVCHLCKAAFRQLSNLNNHSKKHANFVQSPINSQLSIHARDIST